MATTKITESKEFYQVYLDQAEKLKATRNQAGDSNQECTDMIYFQVAIFAAFFISLASISLYMYCKH